MTTKTTNGKEKNGLLAFTANVTQHDRVADDPLSEASKKIYLETAIASCALLQNAYETMQTTARTFARADPKYSPTVRYADMYDELLRVASDQPSGTPAKTRTATLAAAHVEDAKKHFKIDKDHIGFTYKNRHFPALEYVSNSQIYMPKIPLIMRSIDPT